MHLSSAFLNLGRVALLLGVFFVAACPGDGGFVSNDGARPGDEDPFRQDKTSGPRPDVPTVYACDTVDILFVIDNSNSMEEEQSSLVASFPKFIQQIEAITPKIKSFHVGVVSTDIGAGTYTFGSSSSCKPGGDEGKLQHAAGAGCTGTYPKFLEGPSATLAKDFACIAALGTGGCGFEQQLQAALTALSGQSYNGGFLRKNAPLAIVFISDEDDCTASQGTFFDPASATLGNLKTRCVAHLEGLKPISDLVKEFKALKDNPDRVVVAAITGPPGKVVIDETKPAGQVPICSSGTLGGAAAGNRFSEFIKAFGDRGVQHSLCEGDLAPALDVIGKAIERVCLK